MKRLLAKEMAAKARVLSSSSGPHPAVTWPRAHAAGSPLALAGLAALAIGLGACGQGQASVRESLRADVAAQAVGTDPVWRSIGPMPPAVEAAVLSDPSSGTVLIGGTGGGIIRSQDGGRTFAWSNTGLEAISVMSMLMDPVAPGVVYAGTLAGIHKSLDGGQTWRNLGGSLGAVVLVIDPTDHDVLYAGNAPNGGVIRSADGGATWAPVNGGLGTPAVFGLAIDPRNPRVLYAGTAAGAGAWKTNDGGASWSHLAIGDSVYTFLIDADDSDVVYAGTGGNGVLRSTDGGASFQPVGMPPTGVVLSLLQSGGRLYAGTANQGVSASDDGGVTWTPLGVARGKGLVLSADASGDVFLGTSFEGVFVLRAGKAEDDGDEAEPDDEDRGGWHRLGWRLLGGCAGQNGHAITVDPGDPRHVLLSTNDGGLLETRDGKHWRDAGLQGMTARGPRGIAFDPADPRHVYVGGFTGTGFFSSADNGRTWQRHIFGSPAIYTTGVSVDASDHAVYVATLSGDGIWKSTDLGVTYARVDRAPNAAPGVFLGLTGRGITVDPGRPGVVFAAASRGGTAGVWRSLDAGASWVRVATGQVLSVTIDPTDSQVVYASTPVPSVLKSTDGGATFARVDTGLPAGLQTARTGSLQVDPRQPLRLWLGIEGGGAYRSADGGATWAPANAGLADLNVYGLAMDPSRPDVMYASTAASVFSTAARP